MASMIGIPGAWTDPKDAAYLRPGGTTGFNLHQWFTDYGVTDPSQMTLYRYTTIRNLPFDQRFITVPTQGNPYEFTGSAIDNFKMDPQNIGDDIKLTSGGAEYKPGDVAKLNTAHTNATSRLQLNATGNPTASTDPLASALLLARPTLLGGQ